MNDPFLSEPKKKRKQRREAVDEEIDSDEFDSENETLPNKKRKNLDQGGDSDVDSDTEFKEESKTERRRRLAQQYLENLKQEHALPTSNKESEYGDEVDTRGLEDYTFDAQDLDNDIISRRLQYDSMEQKGNIYKFIGSKLQLSKKKVINNITDGYLLNPTGLCVNYPYLYTVSKTLQLVKYDISNLQKAPKRIKYVDMRKTADEEYHEDEISCVAVSPNGKFVVTGGKDKHLIIWNSNNLSLLKKIPLNHKKASINAMAFRKDSNDLYVASDDLKIRIFNVNQFSLIDTLFGHQDSIVGISALHQERCVTVGARDRSAMYWKVAEQTRLTFNSAISFEKYYNQYVKEHQNILHNSETKKALEKDFIKEGSLECVSMVDGKHFVTGSDNGSVSLWTIHKKKPIYVAYQAHGIVPQLTLEQYSGDKDYIAEVQQIIDSGDDTTKYVPPKQAHWITAIYAIPYTDVFITGSWNGQLKVWKIEDNLKKFTLLYNLNGAPGIISSIDAVELDKYDSKTSGKTEKVIAIYATVAKEHRLGRWVKKPRGAKNSIFQAFIKLKN